MKSLARTFLWVMSLTLLLGAAVLTQSYLRSHLVVTAEGHEHAHVHEMGGEDHSEHEHHEHEGETEVHEHGQPLGSNILTNFSFEVGSLMDIYAWSPEGTDPGTSAWRDLMVSAAGNASAALYADSSSSGSELYWKQTLTSFPRGHDLEIGAKFKTASLRGNAFIKLSGLRDIGHGQGTILAHLYQSGLEGDNDWSELSGIVFIPDEVEILMIEVGMFGTGKVWIDSVRAVPREHALPPFAPGMNLLENADFQRNLEGWSLMFYPPVPGALWSIERMSPSGPAALRLQPPPQDDGSGRIYLHQSLSGLKGTEGVMVFSGLANTLDLDGQAYIILVIYTTEDMISSDPIALSGGSPNSRLEASMRIPEGACTAFAYLVAEGKGSALFSEMDLRIQSEP